VIVLSFVLSSAFPGRDDAASTAFTSRAPVVVRVDGGFDWVDAAVGTAAGFGLTLVAGGAILELRRRISPTRGSSASTYGLRDNPGGGDLTKDSQDAAVFRINKRKEKR